MSAPEVRILRANGEFWGLDIMTRATVTPDILVATKPIDPGSSGGGAVVIDSVVETGAGISIRGIVAAYPIAGAGTLTAFDREQQTIQFLQSIVGELVDVVLPRRPTYTNCLLNAYPHDLDGKLRTPFSLGFRQNRIARSSTVVLSRAAERASGTGSGTDEAPNDVGEQPTQPVTAPKQVQDESAGVSFGKALGWLD